MSGLEGVRVLELGELVSAAYAAKLLADLGADVVKVESAQGDAARRRGPFKGAPDPEQSGLFLYLNTNKRSITLEPKTERETLNRLFAWAEIVIHNLGPAQMAEFGLDFEQLAKLNPKLVMCSITPFGLTGPHKDYKGYELTTQHAGGWGYLGPGASERPDLPPLKTAGHQADYQAGGAGAMTAMAAYHRVLKEGVGEHIDLSTQEYITGVLEQAFPHYTYGRRVASRLGRRIVYPWGMYPAKDGTIFMLVIELSQWQGLLEMGGNPEWGSWEIFAEPAQRSENQDVLGPMVAEVTQNFTVMDFFTQGQAKRIPCAPVSNMADAAQNPQLKARDFWVTVEHPKAGPVVHPGAPYKLGNDWWKIRRPAPALGQHNEKVRQMVAAAPKAAAVPGPRATRLPLDGIRVADFSWVWAGPFCGMQLAHLGAEVIKLESALRPDLARRLPIYPVGMPGSLNQCGYFNQYSQGKKSLSLNLTKPEAIAIAKELVAKSDVVLDNFATGVMERLGLGHEELFKIKSDLIIASISGHGHSGPWKTYAGYGPVVASMAGLFSLTGYQGLGPAETGISIGDPNGGLHAAIAICAALVARDRNGGGQYIDVSLTEAITAVMAEGWMEYAMTGAEPQRLGNRDPMMAPHNLFRCAGEDDWVTIACGNDAEWAALCHAMGIGELARDPRFATAAARKKNEDALDATIGEWTRGRSRSEVTAQLQQAGVAAFPSMSCKDLAEDQHLEARGFFARLPHPEVGVMTHAGIPWRLHNAPNGVRSAAPLLGQHTEAVMCGILGYSPGRVKQLVEQQILA